LSYSANSNEMHILYRSYIGKSLEHTAFGFLKWCLKLMMRRGVESKKKPSTLEQIVSRVLKKYRVKGPHELVYTFPEGTRTLNLQSDNTKCGKQSLSVVATTLKLGNSSSVYIIFYKFYIPDTPARPAQMLFYPLVQALQVRFHI